MATHSRRKLAVGTLVLALFALVLDRTVFKEGSPLSPQTADAALSPRDASSVEGHTRDVPKAGAPSAVVAEHLRAVRDRLGVSAGPATDAFDPTRVFNSPTPENEHAAQSSSKDAFVQGHRLMMVLIPGDGSRAGALVDGRLLSVGDTVDNDKIRRRLVSIDSNSAVFDVDGEPASLTMPLPSREDFTKHKLNAVLVASGQDEKRVGIIDGRLQVRIGDMLDGYRVKAIDPGSGKGVVPPVAPSATFEAEGKCVTLWVPQAR